MVFHFRLIEELSNNYKNFQKLQKSTILGPFLVLCCPKLDQSKFSLKIELRQFLALKKPYIHAKNYKETDEPFLR